MLKNKERARERDKWRTKMKPKLKTLKDLRYHASASGYLFLESELKQEAIKRIKEKWKLGDTIDEHDWTSFFNITEKELVE